MITPYGSSESKTTQIQRMFDSIAPSYDRLNRIISLGLDRSWRREAIELIKPYSPRTVLDVATGTGDLAIELAEKIVSIDQIKGIDISEEMMRVGEQKILSMGLESKISFECQDSTALSFEDDSFDAITIGFGIRNFSDIFVATLELRRVLRVGKPLVILELTEPKNPILLAGYKLYSKAFIPLVGRIFSGDSRAYSYLPDSISAVPQREEMVDLLKGAGFSEVSYRSLFPETCAIYIATK